MIDGQNLLVTGGSTGLGAAIARLAVAAGMRVAILDINAVDGQRTADVVGADFWPLDVSQSDQWGPVLDSVEQRMGPVRYACLNAGIMSRPLNPQLSVPAMDEISLEKYHQLVSVNINGTYYGLRHLHGRITAHGGGAIMVTSSVAGLLPIPYDPLYAMTKHALVGLVRSMALAHAAGNVRMNALCPGGFTSDLFPPELWREASLTPDDVAEHALHLLRDGAMGETRVVMSKNDKGQLITPPNILT